MTILQVG